MKNQNKQINCDTAQVKKLLTNWMRRPLSILILTVMTITSVDFSNVFITKSVPYGDCYDNSNITISYDNLSKDSNHTNASDTLEAEYVNDLALYNSWNITTGGHDNAVNNLPQLNSQVLSNNNINALSYGNDIYNLPSSQKLNNTSEYILNESTQFINQNHYYSADEIIEDLQAPAIPQNLNVSAVTGSAIQLTWDASTDNIGVAGYNVYKDNVLMGSSVGNSFVDDTLAAGCTYKYTVKAYDAAGNLSDESNPCFYQIADIEAPAVPQNLNVTSVTGSAIQLSWNASSDNVGVIGYNIYKDNVIAGSSTETSYVDNTLISGATYIYTVRAFDSSGNLSIESNPCSYHMADTEAPAAPTNLTASVVSGSAIVLNWNPSTDNVGIKEYNIYSSGTFIGATSEETNYIITELEKGIEYVFTVRAIDIEGNVSADSIAALAVIPLDAPLILATSVSGSAISITWSDCSDADGYELSINNEVISVGDTTSYTLDPVLPNLIYDFRVRSLKGVFTSDWSAVTKLTSAPGKVEGFDFNVLNESTINLIWNRADGTLSYDIEINGVIFSTAENTYTHANITAAVKNTYRIRAVNGNLIGLWSEPILAASKTIISGGSITQDTVWDRSGGIYTVQRDLTIAYGATLLIKNGVTVKISSGILLNVQGQLLTQGTVTSLVVFTSNDDPEYGGGGIDNEQDCWKGIYVWNTGKFSGDYTVIRYGGYYYSESGYILHSYNMSALNVNGNLDQNHLTISGSYQVGLLYNSNSDTVIENSIIEGSKNYNVRVDKRGITTGTVTFRNDVIRGGNGGIFAFNRGKSGLIIENCLVEDNITEGISIDGSESSGIFLVSGNIISGNAIPLRINLGAITTDIGGGLKADNNYQGNRVSDAVYLSGNPNVNLVLPGYNYINEGSITVPSGKSLTFQPGSVIMGQTGTGLISIDGELIALGTETCPVVFTSVDDPEYGGSGVVNNQDSWQGISVECTGKFSGDYVTIRYGGYYKIRFFYYYFNRSALCVKGKLDINHLTVNSSFQDGLLYNSNSDVIIDNSIIENSEKNNIKVDKGSLTSGIITIRNSIIRNGNCGIYADDAGGSGLVIENNRIEGNTNDGIYLCGCSKEKLNISRNIIKNNTYPITINLSTIKSGIAEGIKPDNVFQENRIENAIMLSGSLSVDLVIPAYKYVIDSTVVILNGRTLTIQPGAVVLGRKTGLIDICGKLIASGTETEPIIFTSTYDSEYGGSGVSDENFSWMGICVESTGEFYGSYVMVRYGGYYRSNYPYKYYNLSALNVKGVLELNNSVISNSFQVGIYYNSSIQPIIKFNSFKNNKSYAINNVNASLFIDASNNYWNSIYGPTVYMEVYNPSTNKWEWKWVGVGDKIQGNIYYNPYLCSDIASAAHFNRKKGAYAPTGNYSYQNTDLSVECLKDTIAFTRSYNSQDTNTESVFGKGWSFNYKSYIKDYEGVDNVKLVKLPDGSQDAYTANADGSFTSCYSRNTLVRQEDGSYILTLKDQTKYGFNSQGFLVWIESPEGNRTAIATDTDGKPLCITDYVGREYTLTYQDGLLNTITGPAGRIVKYYYDSGRLAKVVDPEGIVTNYAYDSNGYLSRITDGDGNLKEAVSYKNSNGVIKADAVTDAYGNVKTYSYDEPKGKTIITDSNGRTTTQWYDTTYNITNSTDAEGKMTSVVYFTDGGVNKYGEISSSTDRYGNSTTYLRDGRGNYTKVVNPDGSYRLYTYDEKNNLTSDRDESGKYTYYIYDSTGTYLMKMVRPLNGTDVYTESSDPAGFAITSYTYYQKGEDGCTINGLIRSITSPEGDTTTYTYDSYGNIKTATDDASNTTTYTYNEVGLLLSTLSPKGELTNYTYDKDGNLITKVLDGGRTTVILYDGLGRKVQEITPNIYQLTPSGDVGYRYTYYGSGKLQTVTDPEGNITTYTYDLYGNLQSETKPNGCIYWYEYDTLNRMSAAYVQETSASQRVLLKTFAYSILTDKKTQKTETTYLNESESAATVYVYDYAGRQVKQTNPDGGIINTIYNSNGTVYSQSDAKGKFSYSRYDGLNRLTEQWIPFGDSKYTYKAVTYDRNGNTTSEKTGVESVALWSIPATLLTTSYVYNSLNQLITAVDPEGGRKEYAYDADGNVIKETVYLDAEKTKVTEYVYNHLGKPDSMTVHVEAGDIYGNTFGDTEDVLLVTTYTYDADANVRTMVTPDGVTTIYTYDFMDRLLSQTAEGQDEYGQPAQLTTSCTYDYAGNVLTATDANRNTTVNTYTQRGLLEKTTDPEGGITAYYYDKAGRLTAKVLPENYYENVLLSEMNRIAFTFDKMNRILLEQDIYFDNNTLSFRTINAKAYQYDLNGNITKTLDALGYNSGTGATISEKINTGYGTSNTYNDANLLLTTLSPATKDRSLTFDIKYTYDAAGRKISETNANNAVTKYYYDNSGRLERTTVTDTTEKSLQQTTYDGMGNILTQTDGNGNVTRYTYNNRLGLLKTKTTAGDTTVGSNTFIYQYDDMGRVVYQKDSMGKVILCSYNHEGQLLGQTEEKEDGSQSITKSQAYDKNGNQRFSTDANGVTTEYVYDGLNRVTQTKITVNGIEQISSSTYDKNGNLLTTTDWLGNTYSNEYDALNRIAKKTDPYGRVIERYEYNDNHAQTRSYDALGNMTVFAYDKNGRLTSTTDPAGHATSQTYDNAGNISTKKDGKNNTTAYAYDVLNRLIRITNAASEITGYTYDLNGNLLTQTDGKVNTITYTYNASNLPSSKAYPADSSGVITSEHYTYYPDGRLKEKTDRNDNLTEYTYDIHGSLLSVKAGSNTISYTYDPAGNMLTMADPTGITSRTYDERGRVLTKTVPDIGTITYAYDIISGVETGCRKERSTDPKGNITDKVYDKAGRLTRVIVGDETTVYTYYDNGNTESVTYSNGYREEYTYYADNRIKTLVNKKADTSVMDSYTYTYDNADNQLTKYEIINNTVKGTTTYAYDVLNRLSAVTEPSGRATTYTYDKAGNRLTETVVYQGTTTLNTYVYDSRNRLTSISTKGNNVLTKVTGYAYDGNGNLLKTTVDSYTNGAVTSSAVTAAFTYDLFNQLITTVTEDGTVVNNAYNAEGYRTVKEVNGVKTYYLYEADKVILEVDEAGNQTGRNVYGINLLMRSIGGETYCYMYNGHADVTALVTEDGSVEAAYYYDAFGNILESSGDVNNSILYSGYQYDKETGLYYLNARMYDPKIARFLQEDTYTGDRNDPLSLNLYTYCSNNPIKYDDPSGHAPTSVHESDTNTIVYAIFCNKIEEESKKIIFYKKDKKGKTVFDTEKTEYEREKWIDKQEKKAKNFAEKLVAGDNYVDQQKLISNNDDIDKKDYDFKTFHAFNLQNNLTRCIDVLLLRNFSYHAVDYYMSGSKGISPKLSLYLGHATYDFTVSTISMSELKTNKDNYPLLDQNGNIAKITTSVILPLGGYTETEKAMFMSGMGLHTLQDSYFHVVEKHKSSPFVDVITYDYVGKEWNDENSGEFTIDGVGEVIDGKYKATVFTGGKRYQETLRVTAAWADRLVDNYGDQMFGYIK